MSTQDQEINQEILNSTSKTVTFTEGFARGNSVIKEVTLRRPKAGNLRGLSLATLLQLDVNAIAKLTPRISSPTMNESDVYELAPADLTSLGKEIISFFVQDEE